MYFITRKSCKIDIIEKTIHKRHLAIFVDFSRFTVYPARKSKEKSKSEFSVTSPFSQSQKNGFTSISQIGFCQPLSKFFPSFPMYTVGIFGIYSVHVALSSRWSKHRFVGTPYFLYYWSPEAKNAILWCHIVNSLS